jgi:hypothetical protein
VSIDQLTAKPSASPPAPATRPFALREHAAGLVLIAATAAVLAAFFVGLYVVHGYRFPIGWDTARYLFHTNFIAERGLGTRIPHLLPLASPVNANRPGFPVIALTLSSLFRTSPFRVAAQIPLAGATAMALAIGAFASRALHLKRWEAIVVSVLAATSAPVIRLIAPETYTDNLLAAAVCAAALIAVMTAVQEGRSFVPAILLLGVGGVIHPATFVVVIGALALAATAYLPGSWQAWRNGDTSLLSTPAARLGIVLSGAAAVAAAGVFGLSARGPDVRGVYRGELEKKLREDLPLYRFPLTLPIALIGLVGIAVRSVRRTSAWLGARFLFVLSAAWAVVTLIGLIPFVLGRDLPAHRFLALFLPLPILLAMGVLAVKDLLTKRVSLLAGTAAVVIGVAGLTFLGYRDLYVGIPHQRGVEWMDKGKLDDALTAERYLDAVHAPEGAPVVYVMDDRGPNPVVSVAQQTYVIAANLSPERTEDAHFYLGDPDRYLQGKPTFHPGNRLYNQMSSLLWRDVRGLVARRPVALMLASYNPEYLETVQRHPELKTINNAMILSGPPPPAAHVRQAIPASGKARLVAFDFATLILLTLVGLGWALFLLPGGVRSYEVLAVAPAFGIAFLVLAGILVDRIGFRLTGLPGAATPLITAAAGLVFGVRRLLRTPDLFPAS